MTKFNVQTFAALLATLLQVGPANKLCGQPISSNATSFSASGPEVEGYRLTISTSNSTYAVGQFVPLSISLENLSTNASEVSAGSGFMYHSFQVTAPSGLCASMTGYGTNALYPQGYRITWAQVPAEKSYTRYAALNLLFNLTNTGDYSVMVSRQVPTRTGPYKEVWVRAGPLKIVITEPQKP